MDDEAALDALRALLGSSTFLTGAGLVARLAQKAGVSTVTARVALARLAQQHLISGVSSQGEPHSRVHLLVEAAPEPQAPTLERWSSALHECGLSDQDMKALLPCHEALGELEHDDLLAVAAGLARMRSNQAADAGRPRFILSARYLLGSSKLLGALPSAAVRAFGIDLDRFPDAPPYVVVAGPANPEAVVLIENPHAFEEVIHSGAVKRIACITTFGYGLTRAGDAYGRQLAELITAESLALIPLVRSGSPPSIPAMLAHPALFFWGDLDREGLRIYAGLRKRFPQLRASAMLRPMLDALRVGRSHPYAKLVAKDNQGTASHHPEDVRALAEACETRAVDQEIVEREAIAMLGASGLCDILEDLRLGEKELDEARAGRSGIFTLDKVERELGAPD